MLSLFYYLAFSGILVGRFRDKRGIAKENIPQGFHLSAQG